MKLTLPTKHICSFSPHLNTTADKQQTLIKGFLMPVKESRLPAAAQQLGTLVLFSRERSDPTSENELGGHSFYSPSGYIISTNNSTALCDGGNEKWPRHCSTRVTCFSKASGEGGSKGHK